MEPTFIASSRKTICEIGSFFNFKTFSNVYTLTQQSFKPASEESERAYFNACAGHVLDKGG
jgi:hypothetical protein